MRKLILAGCLMLALVGCNYGPNVRVLGVDPPWCKDYIVTDPVTGKEFLRYNSPQGNLVHEIEKWKR